MKQPTTHRMTLSIEEMERLLRKMQENRQCNQTLSTQVSIDLDFDTDYETLRIAAHADNVYQYNAYGECCGKRFTI